MTNQFLAIFYLYKLHRFIIYKLKIKHFVCDKDYYIIIHHNKEYLKYCLKEITKILNKLKKNIKKNKYLFNNNKIFLINFLPV